MCKKKKWTVNINMYFTWLREFYLENSAYANGLSIPQSTHNAMKMKKKKHHKHQLMAGRQSTMFYYSY